ncbi:Hypothetical predicted protein [Pelobates cultripes]|uniref:Uncharacterized protein n=1 Tax=Pelobates cultripes TaxID=61616 RepID=A0AAD1RXS5_PELCU|nr:Hypothetical predicted protein [Pelobates cultripes]
MDINTLRQKVDTNATRCFGIDILKEYSTKHNRNFLFLKLERLLKQELKLKWEVATLQQYIIDNITPRGLRLFKDPAFPIEYLELKERWYEAMEDCSFVFMDIIIECRKKKLVELHQEIKEIQNILESLEGGDNPKERVAKIAESVDRLEEDIKRTKKKKFLRDMDDYKNNRVRNFQKKYDSHYEKKNYQEKKSYQQYRIEYENQNKNSYVRRNNKWNGSPNQQSRILYERENPNFIPVNDKRRTHEGWRRPLNNIEGDYLLRRRDPPIVQRRTETKHRQNIERENFRISRGQDESKHRMPPNTHLDRRKEIYGKNKDREIEKTSERRREEEYVETPVGGNTVTVQAEVHNNTREAFFLGRNTREITTWFHPMTPRRTKRKEPNLEEIEEEEEQGLIKKKTKKNIQ